MLFVSHFKILRNHCLQFLLGVKIAWRETENNVSAKFWGDKKRALWYVMVFSGVANCNCVIEIVTIKLQIEDVFLEFIDAHLHLAMFYTRCYNVLPSVFFAVFELQSD